MQVLVLKIIKQRDNKTNLLTLINDQKNNALLTSIIPHYTALISDNDFRRSEGFQNTDMKQWTINERVTIFFTFSQTFLYAKPFWGKEPFWQKDCLNGVPKAILGKRDKSNQESKFKPSKATIFPQMAIFQG